jgi:uncharacterized protein (TIGR02271 family)
MSDARDTNRDGKVSLMEKVKDKLHLGHKDKDAEYTTTHHTTHTTSTDARDLNRDGNISTAEKLRHTGDSRDLNRDAKLQTSSSHTGALDLNRDGHISTAEEKFGNLDLNRGDHISTTNKFADSRDLNRDGHISATEKLATGSTAFDSHDLNRDGHISASEKLASGFHHGRESEEARLKLHEEQLSVSKREVGAGEVDIHKRVQEEHVQQTIPLRHEEVTVERRPLTGAAEPGARIAAQDELVRVPLHREEIVTEKRVVPTEEVVVRKKEVMDQQTVGATLRSEFVETMQTQQGASLGAFDARDTNRDGHVSMGEKLKGDTAFGASDARDTNRDGHVSMGEKLKGDSAFGAHDARDTNRDGHVSMGEKLKDAAAPKAARG